MGLRLERRGLDSGYAKMARNLNFLEKDDNEVDGRNNKEKSQNCVKAAIAFVCTTCKRQLLVALLQLITFVSTTAIDNILSTTPIVNFCIPYCNRQNFYGTTTFVWTIATITINITLLQLLTF